VINKIKDWLNRPADVFEICILLFIGFMLAIWDAGCVRFLNEVIKKDFVKSDINKKVNYDRR